MSRKRNNMKFILFVLIAFFIFQELAVCQTNIDESSSSNFKKNVVYATFGLVPGITYNLNYERQILHPVKGPLNSINIKLCYGKYDELFSDLPTAEKMYSLSSDFIFGSGSSHFETGLGVAYLFTYMEISYYGKKTEIKPIYNAGYRFQKKNGYFVFRTGVGWPDCFYVSLGFAL
jgi:hypothetical protein